jgi:hypothetical protein
MVDQPDKRAAYNDSAVRISANQIPDRPLLAQGGQSAIRLSPDGTQKEAKIFEESYLKPCDTGRAADLVVRHPS